MKRKLEHEQGDESEKHRDVFIQLRKQLATEHPFRDVDEMVTFICNNGMLNAKTLSLLARLNEVKFLSFTRSYQALQYPKFTKPLLEGFQSLVHLELCDLQNMQDNEARYLINLPNLQSLDISGTRITSRAILYILKHSRWRLGLRVLKVMNMIYFQESWIRLLSKFEHLLYLDLFGNPVGLEAVLKLLDDCQSAGIHSCHLPELTSLRLPIQLSDYLIDKHVNHEAWILENGSSLVVGKKENILKPLRFSHLNATLGMRKIPDYVKMVYGKHCLCFTGSTTFNAQERLKQMLRKRELEEKAYSILRL